MSQDARKCAGQRAPGLVDICVADAAGANLNQHLIRSGLRSRHFPDFPFVVPAMHSKWEIREVPRPEPGPNQVLIKIRASGICYTDVHQTGGALPGAFPRILGHEPVGEIVAIGLGVTTRKVGDRVGVPWIQTTCGRCEWCKRGKPMFCEQQVGTGGAMQGGHAEYMLAYAGATVLLPDALPYEQAAPIFCAGYTVWSGLRWADPQPGERVAVVGIGGLGHLAVQGGEGRRGWA